MCRALLYVGAVEAPAPSRPPPAGFLPLTSLLSPVRAQPGDTSALQCRGIAPPICPPGTHPLQVPRGSLSNFTLRHLTMSAWRPDPAALPKCHLFVNTRLHPKLPFMSGQAPRPAQPRL